jgi:endonuclease/exonuclease/phosphatase family metal-dependent hydrolase
MPHIPEAFTDCPPAVAGFNGRLYVAYKDKDCEHIRLASTIDPDDELSWETDELMLSFPGVGPEEVSTPFGPALSVFENRLWLGFTMFTEHRDNIWLISMGRDGTWSGHGNLGVFTHGPPGMDENLIVYRHYPSPQVSAVDFSVRPFHSEDIPSARSNSGPSAAFWRNGEERKMVVYAYHSEVFVTQFRLLPGIGTTWTDPEPIPEAHTLERPGLAMHEHLMYMVYKHRNRPDIGLSVYDGRFWFDQGFLPLCRTHTGPALGVHNGQTLYVVYVEAGTDRVSYVPVPVPGDIPGPLTVMTLNSRIHPLDPIIFGRGDDPPNHWRQRLPRIVTMLNLYESGQGPHIIGVQEMRGRSSRDLGEHLPEGYEGWYERRGGLIQGNEGVALFYRTDRVECLERGQIRMRPRDRQRRAGCRRRWTFINRNIIWGRFRDLRYPERTFYVCNTHFGGSDCEILGECLILNDLLTARSHPADPVIAMGDFNIGEYIDGDSHDAYETLLDITGLENSFRRIHPFYSGQHFATGNAGYSNKRMGNMIDHILVSPSIHVYDADIDRTMFTTGGLSATVPCLEADEDTGSCTDVGELDEYQLMYSDHWAVWACLGWADG